MTNGEVIERLKEELASDGELTEEFSWVQWYDMLAVIGVPDASEKYFHILDQTIALANEGKELDAEGS